MYKVTLRCSGGVRLRRNLVELRGKRTLTQVAEEIGITRQMLRAIEYGTRNPSLEVARRIAIYYSKPIEEIFFDVKRNEMLPFK